MPNFDVRRNIERAIQNEEDTLQKLASHINERLPWSEWPDADRKAFALALLPPPGRNQRSNAGEKVKAQKLLNHFFPNERDREIAAKIMGMEKLGVEEDRQVRRNAERIRADITGIVQPWRIDLKNPSVEQVGFDIPEDIDNTVSPARKRKVRF